MTCIIGLVEKNQVYIGADSAAASGWETRQTALKKVFRLTVNEHEEMVIGYTDSFRMGQILQYHLELKPQPESQDNLTYIVREFTGAVRTAFREQGYLRVEDNQESGGTFLMGYRGQLYSIQGDFQVNHYLDGFEAVGCGREYALGAMQALKELPPKDRVLRALQITAHFSNGVTAPFHIEVLSVQNLDG